MELARRIDLQSVGLIRLIIRTRAWLLRARQSPRPPSRGIIADMVAMGWGVLLDEPGRLFVAGATCEPWRADVVFHPVPPEQFRDFAPPGQVKIAWTLEVEPLGPALTRLVTETRAVATDPPSRVRFRRYWRVFSPGILAIRWVLLGTLKRQAERRWKERAA
jgi:hypothetical protein